MMAAELRNVTRLEQRVEVADAIVLGKAAAVSAASEGLPHYVRFELRPLTLVAGAAVPAKQVITSFFRDQGTHWDVGAMLEEELGATYRGNAGWKMHRRVSDFWSLPTAKQEGAFLLWKRPSGWVVGDIYAGREASVAVAALARMVRSGQWDRQAPILFSESAPEEVQSAAVRWIAENGWRTPISAASLEKALRGLTTARAASLLDEAIEDLGSKLMRGPPESAGFASRVGFLGELLTLAPPLSGQAIEKVDGFTNNLMNWIRGGLYPDLVGKFLPGVKRQHAIATHKDARREMEKILERFRE